MSGSVNKVILIGNVCADAELRRTQDGRPIANLRLATNDTWRDRNSGERREKSEFHTIVVFNEGLCKIVEQYVRKGAKLYIEGSLVTRKWADQQGNDRYSTEIHLQGFNSTLTMLDGPSGDSKPKQEREQTGYDSQDETPRSGSYARDLDDDIPFAPEWR